MALDFTKEKGIPLDRQEFDWRDIVRVPISKLDDDAFTRIRIILMNGVEHQAVRFSHWCARMNKDLRLALAAVRRIEHHQQTLVNWLLPGDQSPLETTIAFEQVATEVTASVAESEPDPYLAQVYRFGLLEDFDHLYRYAALMDRLEGKDANAILQSYTDIRPGRPTIEHHRAPEDDLRSWYDRATARPLTKLNALTILGAEHQTRDFYMTIGPMYTDPLARQLFAEIASVEEQHVTQYESIIDPDEGWLEKWLLHEATEVWNYFSNVQWETNERVRSIWDRFLAYEIGHLRFVMDLFRKVEKRDPEEVIGRELPEPIRYSSHRQFVRDVVAEEAELQAVGDQFVHRSEVPKDSISIAYRTRLNASGSPSNVVSAEYVWRPGTELAPERRAA